ncbi:MAG: EamA family transporter [Firmicutes bacterium]|nr:EamA family transporter [Bacillota bacterium]
MSIYMFWPIILAVLSDIFYQICAKSTPESLNPFASLTITYLVGAAVSVVVYFMTSEGQSLIAEWKGINWTTFVLGLAIVGLEAGSIYMYKAGWNMNTGYIVKALILSIALIAIGYFLYKENLSMTKVAGIGVCLIGIFLINK